MPNRALHLISTCTLITTTLLGGTGGAVGVSDAQECLVPVFELYVVFEVHESGRGVVSLLEAGRN